LGFYFSSFLFLLLLTFFQANTLKGLKNIEVPHLGRIILYAERGPPTEPLKFAWARHYAVFIDAVVWLNEVFFGGKNALLAIAQSSSSPVSVTFLIRASSKRAYSSFLSYRFLMI
jgi:hypothetical protein